MQIREADAPTELVAAGLCRQLCSVGSTFLFNLGSLIIFNTIKLINLQARVADQIPLLTVQVAAGCFLAQASIKEGPDGGKIVSISAEEASQTNAGTEPTAEEAQKGEGQAAEAAAAAGKPEGSGDAAPAAAPAAAAAAANDSNNQSIFPEGPQEVPEPAAAPKATEQVQVLRHLAEGRSANFSSMRQIIILPLENSKAKEVLKEGSVVEEEQIEQLQKQVEKLRKFPFCLILQD